MNYRYLGKTGLKVSELCLGAMTFGRENEATEEESFQMMDRFVAWGGNFIDTANVYSTGISEEIVGRWLKKQNRDDPTEIETFLRRAWLNAGRVSQIASRIRIAQ